MGVNIKTRLRHLYEKHTSWTLFGRTASDMHVALQQSGIECREEQVEEALKDESNFTCEFKDKNNYYRPIVKETLKRKRSAPERYDPVSAHGVTA